MDNTSVSRGVFVFKGKHKFCNKLSPKEYKHDFMNEPWYDVYKQILANFEYAAKEIKQSIFQDIVNRLIKFVDDTQNTNNELLNIEIPTAVLLTGVNVPDHASLFETLTNELKSITPYIAMVFSRDANNVKNLIETTVYQLTNTLNLEETPEIKKSQCNLKTLEKWYKTECTSKPPLIIIISDFESTPPEVLRDFILVLSSYTKYIKFILIFGVATTLHAVHRTLPYDATSKLNVEVFRTQTQVQCLSSVIEKTIFSSNIPFKLTGNAFQLLVDMFLFYDFSVDSFLQNYKICIMQHCYENNTIWLCCNKEDIEDNVSTLNKEDLNEVINLPSIKKFIEENNITKNEDLSKNEMKKIITDVLIEFHNYMDIFLIVLECLHDLTATLPNAPLGKHLREIYAKAVTLDLPDSKEYKECIQLLGFLSKDELISKLESIIKILEKSNSSVMKKIHTDLLYHMNTIKVASLEIVTAPSETLSLDQKLSRAELKAKLLKMSRVNSKSPYKQAQTNLIEYLDRNLFYDHLINPNQITAHEIFCFSDATAVKDHIRGAVKAAIHLALNDPQRYLKCDCCKLENDEAIPSTLPDLSIIYKLHRESGKLINMYDWLQAFNTIINPQDNQEENREVDPKIQARFTRAVAELEFLGFIKTSRRKTDHVKKLT